ncbi:MAG: GNAT family N-acetyltransferase, partial [Clostridia bacterium]|nr:GNAT family N-acetyltransferase [Clostridia bacterium]
FLRIMEENPQALMLVAFIDGEHAGNCSFSGHNKMKTRHRCDLAIALYQKFCGLGLGRVMIQTVLDVAKDLGYEQMELEVIDGNDPARHLYESLGFVPYGVRPNAMKYKDGTYRDETLMVLKL